MCGNVKLFEPWEKPVSSTRNSKYKNYEDSMFTKHEGSQCDYRRVNDRETNRQRQGDIHTEK